MDWIVRQATLEHAPIVREIARESWHGAYDDILGSDRVDGVVDEWYAIDGLEESIADAAARDDVVFLLALSAEDGTDAADPVGFTHAGVHSDADSVGLITRLYARPAVWGDGVGTALLERVETALESSCGRLRVVVLADNEIGISFYESRGFERAETRDSDLGDGLEEYIYEKPL